MVIFNFYFYHLWRLQVSPRFPNVVILVTKFPQVPTNCTTLQFLNFTEILLISSDRLKISYEYTSGN